MRAEGQRQSTLPRRLGLSQKRCNNRMCYLKVSKELIPGLVAFNCPPVSPTIGKEGR